MRRILLFLACLGCLFPAHVVAQPASPADRIVFWTSQFEAHKIATIRYLAKAFTALTGGPEVEVVGYAEDEFTARLASATRAGRPPDIVEGPTLLLAALDQRGLLDTAPVNRALARLGESSFAAGSLAAVRSGPASGHFALPMHAWVQGVWYRRDWFREAGLDPPDNVARLLRAARHFHRPSEERYGIVMGTAGDVYAEQAFLHLLSAFEGDPNGRDVAAPHSLPHLTDALTYYRTLSGLTPPGPVKWSHRERFLNGKAAMIVYSTFMIGNMTRDHRKPVRPVSSRRPPKENAVLTDQVDVVTCIGGPESGPCARYGELSALSVPAGRAGPPTDTLVDFLSFLLSPEPFTVWLHMAPGGMLPQLRLQALPETFFLDLRRIYLSYGQSRFRQLLNRSPFESAFYGNLRSLGHARFSGVIPSILSAVLDGGVSVDQGARELNRVLTQLE